MNLKIYKSWIRLKNSLSEFWYWLMKPVAYLLTISSDKRYNKRKARITKQQAIKWIAEDIARYVIRHNREVEILICKYANVDDFWYGCTLASYNVPYIKRNKTKMAYYKFNRDIEFQEEIINYLKSMKGIVVNENVEEFPKWKNIDNYKKTCVISQG